MLLDCANFVGEDNVKDIAVLETMETLVLANKDVIGSKRSANIGV